MSNERTTLIAAFDDHLQARRALERLLEADFSESEAWLVENSRDAAAAAADGNRRNTSVTDQDEPKHGFTAFIDRMFGLQDEAPEKDTYRNRLSQESTDYIAQSYESNRHLLVVSTNAGKIEEARQILTTEGATIDDQANTMLARDFDETLTMRLREEELIASKEQVESGEVSLRKEVVTETRTIEVPVSHEELVIERRPLSASERVEGETIGSDSETMNMRLMEEQVTISKKLVPKEEVSVSKRKVSEVKKVSEDVRHEEARIERKGTAARRGVKPDDTLPH